MPKSREAFLRTVYRVGWKIAAKVPAAAVTVISRPVSWVVQLHNGRHVQTLRHNLTVATGTPADARLIRAAIVSYLRNLYEMLALPGWDTATILGKVSTDNEAVFRKAFTEQGAVVALPHSGNWDLAGAWACLTGMPVSTVAEQLDEAEFRAFLEFRELLGMEVFSHADPTVVSALVRAVRRGRLVCLVADRDLYGTGVDVRWGTASITMPAGPALVARMSGAALIPAVCRFTDKGMRISFGAPITSRPGRAGLRAMTQDVADFFSAQIAEHPADWHLMQPFFPEGRGSADETPG